MKKFLFLLMLTGSGFAGNAQYNSERDPYMTKSLSNDAISRVKIETTGGNITVEAAGTSEARLEVFVQSNNSRNSLSKDEIKKMLEEQYDLSTTVHDHTLTAIAEPRHKNMDWKKGLSISFKAFVPSNVSTDLNTSGGNINLKGISGSQNFTTSGGNLNLDDLSGKIKGRTSGGNLNLHNLKDDIDLSTSGGNIEAENSNGNISLTTSGGSLHLDGLGGNIKATTSGGNVHGNDISGELYANTSGGSIVLKGLSCSLETSTSGGNIEVSIKQLGQYVRISNSGGNIDLVMPKNQGADLKLSAEKVKTSGLENFNGSKEDDSVKGKLNGGGIPVTASSSSGNINFSLK
ncbi:MAG: hypothetical protein ABJA57_00100 [Ginsengibacter sp.]